MQKGAKIAALVGLLALGVVVSPAAQQRAEPEPSTGTADGGAIENMNGSTRPLPHVRSFAEAAALKAVDEFGAAAAVAATAGTRVDPMFRNCRDARMRGFGPYDRGSHVEYYWYPDGDLDGTTCESH